VSDLPLLVVAHPGDLERQWPKFLPAFREGVRGHFELEVREPSEPGGDLDLTDARALVLFDCEPTREALARSCLQIVGGVTDGRGIFELDHLWARGIPFVDATAGWAQSVAEFTMGLMIASLRRIPYWHRRLALGWPDWTYPFGQYCDDDDYVNGTVAGKSVGIVGLGEIGSRVARWCSAFGARVSAYDPFVTGEQFSASNAIRTDLDALIAMSDILVVSVPKTASSVGMIDSRRVCALAPGSLVITTTRTVAIDVSALRQRVVRNELFWASDVFDVEPLPVEDSILNRPNVIHTPHVAGRTEHANEGVARILATEFVGYLKSSTQPRHALTPERVRVRLGASSLKEREQLRLQATGPSPRLE
jgi:phosphoglycerate dehydrogenase-like enzyme